jgi:hypothetical protein
MSDKNLGIGSMEEQLRAMALQDNERKQNMISDIFAAVSTPLREFPFNDFVKWYLPLFANDGNLPKDHIRNGVRNWLRVAGSLIEEVRLVDHRGNHVITVPSMMSPDVIPLTTERPPAIEDHQENMVHLAEVGGYNEKRAYVDALEVAKMYGLSETNLDTVKEAHSKLWESFLDEITKLSGFVKKQPEPEPIQDINKPLRFIDEDDGFSL